MSLPLTDSIRTVAWWRQLEGRGVTARRAGMAGAVVGVATVLALLFALGRYLAAPHRTPSSLLPILVWELARWYVWLLLLPVLRRALDESVATQFAAVFGISALHTLVIVAVEQVVPEFLAGAASGAIASFAGHAGIMAASDLLACAALVAALHAIRYRDRFRERDQRATALQAQLDRAELELLGLRIRPHFLFNALNAVSGLMHDDVDAADEMLSALGELLRSALAAGGAQEIPLREEVDFLRRYLAIMRLRLGDRLTTNIELDAGVVDTLVPNLVLQPLVENAVRYGASRLTGTVHVEVRAERCPSGVRLRVIDNGPGLPALREGGRRRDGIGLRTTRERLRQTYGTAYRLELINRPPPNGGVEAVLVLPFRPDVRRRVS
ncbi:MAG TPA: histidine kinase [Gemmatimonadaceae bacterium]|nr:histidine kinase [Gemmatimonadaceae bacterium]